MRVVVSVLIFVVLTSSVRHANSEPGPTVAFLMQEKASQFSLGMHRLRLYIQSKYGPAIVPISKNDKAYYTNVHYDWNSNRILIEFISNQRSGNASALEDECTTFFFLQRLEAKELILLGRQGDGMYGQFFMPDGYTSGNYALVGSEIDKIIKLRLKSQGQYCEGMLLEDGFMLSK